MLTEEQYVALKNIRDSFASAAKKPDDMTAYLYQQGFIKIKRFKYTTQDECAATYIKTLWTLTPAGQKALNDFEYSAQEKADKMSNDETVKKAERKFNLFNTVLGAVLGAVITLVIQNFAEILDFFISLFQ